MSLTQKEVGGVGVTRKETLLLHKLPQQWRSLLSRLFNRSLERDKLMSMMAMCYRRQVAQPTASWDGLLTQFTKVEPVVGEDGNLCFQPVLWSFPERFVEGVLRLLLRFQDSVSADSIDRFLKSALPKDRSPLVCSVLQELRLSLADRSGNCAEEWDVGCKSKSVGWRKSVHSKRTGVLIDSVSAFDRDIDGSDNSPDGHVKRKEIVCDDREIQVKSPDLKCVPSAPPNSLPVKSLCSPNSATARSQSDTKDCMGNDSENARNCVIIVDSDDDPAAVDVDDEEFGRFRPREQGMQEDSLKTEKPPNKTTVKVDSSPSESFPGKQTEVQKRGEVLSTGDGDIPLDLDLLTSLPLSQVDEVCETLCLNHLDDVSLSAVVERLVTQSENLTHTVSTALITSIVKRTYLELAEPPSRQLMKCVSELAGAFPQQLASVLCGCLQQAPCTGVQAEMVSTLCQAWDRATQVDFLKTLCDWDLPLSENLLPVIQGAVADGPDVSPGFLHSLLRLLETGAVPLAKNAKYGRFVLHIVKSYKSQMDASHHTALKTISSLHTSLIRKSLRSAVDALLS